MFTFIYIFFSDFPLDLILISMFFNHVYPFQSKYKFSIHNLYHLFFFFIWISWVLFHKKHFTLRSKNAVLAPKIQQTNGKPTLSVLPMSSSFLSAMIEIYKMFSFLNRKWWFVKLNVTKIFFKKKKQKLKTIYKW